jgi:hypothetical protein
MRKLSWPGSVWLSRGCGPARPAARDSEGYQQPTACGKRKKPAGSIPLNSAQNRSEFIVRNPSRYVKLQSGQWDR